MGRSKYKEDLKFQKKLLKKARSEKDLQKVYDIKATIRLIKAFMRLEKKKILKRIYEEERR